MPLLRLKNLLRWWIKLNEISSEVSWASSVADVSDKTDSSVPSDSESSPGSDTIYVLEQPALLRV